MAANDINATSSGQESITMVVEKNDLEYGGRSLPLNHISFIHEEQQVVIRCGGLPGYQCITLIGIRSQVGGQFYRRRL